MTFIQGLILGIVQGLTEFLPVSSSGHLVLLQWLFGVREGELFVDVLVHGGTLVAVLAYFKADLRDVISGFRGRRSSRRQEAHAHGASRTVRRPGVRAGRARSVNRENSRMIVRLIVIATIPTVLMGFLFEDVFSGMFKSLGLTGAALLITGIILFLTRTAKDHHLYLPHMTTLHALLIGLAQGFSIMPGISRSGITISIALLLGFQAGFAVKFSFLLSIPAVLGALALQLYRLQALPAGIFVPTIFAAFAAMFAGYIAIAMLVQLTHHNRLSYFAYYLWPLGLLLMYLGYR